MVTNPNSIRFGYFDEGSVSLTDPTFQDTLGASLGYNYAPIYNTIANSIRYRPQEGYNWKDDIEGYELFATQLYQAVSPEHMSALKGQIEESINRRQVLQNSSFLAQFGAGIFDPINIVALPFGGPSLGVGRSALRVGAGVGALEAGLEIGRQTDPLQTAEEGAINILSASLFGAGFGAAIGGVNAKAYSNMKASLKEEALMQRRLELMGDIDSETLQTPRSERRFGNDSDDYLQEQINMFEREAARSVDESIARANTQEQPLFEARANEQRSYAKALKQEQAMRELEELGVDLDDPFRIMNTAYTDSFLYKAVSTPMKRALQSTYPSFVKEVFVKSFSDSGIALALNSVGLPTPQSVFQKSAVNRGEFVRAHDMLLGLWRDDTGAVAASRLDIDLGVLSRRLPGGSNQTYKQWLTSINEKRIKGADQLTENETKAIAVINNYFENAKIRLEENGLIGTAKGVNTRIRQLESTIEDLNARLVVAEGLKTKKAKRQVSLLKGELKRLGVKLGTERQTKLALEEGAGTQGIEDVFFPRFWDKGQIRKRRKEFSDILFRWYNENPYVYELNANTAEFERITLDTRPEKIQERVDLTIDRILGEKDPSNVDTMGFGYGRSKHFRHRQIDIPNSLVTEFIVTDPLSAMKTYAARIEPRIEFAKMFGKDVDGVMFDLEYEMVSKGYSDRDISKMRRDYMHLYDRVAGAVLRDPDALSQKAARIMRDAASLNYLGSAGLAALPDFARILMEHDAENVIRGMQALMDKNVVNLAVNETRYAGEAIDILLGSSHLRLHDDLSNNLDANELLNNARNAFHIMNGLGPMTVLAKQLAGIVDSHTIIDYSIRYNKLTDQELTWLAKYGIGKDEAAAIAKSPWEKTDKGLYLANTDDWDEATRATFKSALNSGVLNTIMAATPADRPIINDGVVYIPSHIGRMFGFKEDSRIKGYTRIENGFLGLPFQFYSYMLANVNKTVGAFAQGQVKNRLLGVSAAFGLAYMSLSIRTPNYIWEDLSWRDRFARTFDMSGIAALYSDLFYTSLHTSLALGGPNITNGLISPKYPQKPSTLDAFTGIAGAGPSWTADTLGGIYEFAFGDIGDGARTVVRNLPFARMWFLKDDINQITKAWAQ